MSVVVVMQELHACFASQCSREAKKKYFHALKRCFTLGYISLKNLTTLSTPSGSHAPPQRLFGAAPNPPGTINTSTSFGGSANVCVGIIVCATRDLSGEGSPSAGPVETGSRLGPMMLSLMLPPFGLTMGWPMPCRTDPR